MNTLILMQGIPGSGKSTVAQALADSDQPGYASWEAFHQEKPLIYSTDEFWYLADPKRYQFTSEKLAEAHEWNQKRVSDAMNDGVRTIIVDNTNIKRDHVIPYLVAAAEHGYDVQVVRVACDPTVAVLRQKDRPEDRQIPASVIFRMHKEMEDLV